MIRALKLILLIVMELSPIIDDVTTFFERRRQERKFKKTLKNGHTVEIPNEARNDTHKSDNTLD
jgi:hypothetical protein